MERKVVLREEVLESDVEDFFRWANLEEWQYYDEPDAKFHSISRDEFDRRQRQMEEPPHNSCRWEIDAVDGKHIGWINYYDLDQGHNIAFVGICLPEEETWGKGYGKDALSQLVNYMFKEMKLKEIRIATWTGNSRMIRCAEKCGFREASRGPHRAETSVRGEPLERIELSITREDWWKRS